jgi:Tol biopolymer transport system component
LRKALADDADNPQFIEVIAGHGYRFVADVTKITEGGVDPTDHVSAHSARVAADEVLNPGIRDDLLARGLPGRTEPVVNNADAMRLSRWRYLGWGFIGLCVASVGIWLKPSRPEPKLFNPIRITHSTEQILSPLLTDGVRIYYQKFDKVHYSIAEVAKNGGDAITLASHLANPELCDLSADGGSLLVRDLDPAKWREGNEPIYVQSLLGGETRRVGEILAYDAAWFPDGNQILFSADGSLYACDREGKATRRLLAVPGNAYWIRWSPDAKVFRFTVIDRHTEAKSIWEADANGGQLHRVFPQLGSGSQHCCGSWIPDGRLFVFQVRDQSSFQIMARRESAGLLSSADRTPVLLTSGPMSYLGPLPSKGEPKLFFRAELLKVEIVRFDPVSRHFVTFTPGISARTASFSTDGEWIAFGSARDNNLWRARTHGGQMLQLTTDFQQVAMPRWSHDGRFIAFMGRRYGTKWNVFTIGSGGGNLRAYFFDKGAGDPDWSPDDSTLLFGNVLENPSELAIHTLELATGKVSTVSGSIGYVSPRWSPDGRFIVAVNVVKQGLDLYDFTSKTWSSLTKLNAGYPSWSHNGKYVYFFLPANGRRAIWRVNVRNHKEEEAASLEDVEQPTTIFGTWIGLAPDDSPLALRNLSTDDIYASTLVDR